MPWNLFCFLFPLGSDELPAIEAPKSPESPPIERKVCEPNQILTTYDKLKDISGEDSLDEIKKNLYSVIKSSAGYRTLWCEMPEVSNQIMIMSNI